MWKEVNMGALPLNLYFWAASEHLRLGAITAAFCVWNSNQGQVKKSQRQLQLRFCSWYHQTRPGYQQFRTRLCPVVYLNDQLFLCLPVPEIAAIFPLDLFQFLRSTSFSFRSWLSVKMTNLRSKELSWWAHKILYGQLYSLPTFQRLQVSQKDDGDRKWDSHRAGLGFQPSKPRW